MELRRQQVRNYAHAVLTQERNGLTQLPVVGHLATDDRRRGVANEAELFAPRFGEERYRVMVCVAAEEDGALTAPVDFLCQREAEVLLPESACFVHIVRKQIQRPDARDLERAGHQRAV